MNVLVDESYRLLAAQYVRRQLKHLTDQLDGVRESEDMEYVHRARVASRRLRAGLRMFCDCFDRKRVKRWRKEVCRLTNKLGDARDRDVQIEFVCDVLCRLQERSHYPGIARLLVKLELERKSLQPRVVRAVGRFESSPVPKQISATAKALVSRLTERGVTVQSEFVFQQAEQHILSRLKKLLGYQESLAHPEDQAEHHAMRIAAKRLRYTMEICTPVYNSRLDEFVETAKQLQTLLGDLHDCDVWVEDLRALLDEERGQIVSCYGHPGPLARLQAGIDYLQAERQEQRQRVFRELTAYWQQLQRQGLWDKLERTLRSAMDQSAGPELDT